MSNAKLAVLIASIFAAQCAMAKPIIGVLRFSEVEKGCGCNFSSIPRIGGDPYASTVAWQFGQRAQIRIDDRIEWLEVTDLPEVSRKRYETSMGDVHRFALKNELTDVNVRAVVTQICKPRQSECESIGYKAEIVVRNLKGIARLRAEGSCGC